MSTPREPSDDRSAAPDASKRPAATPPAPSSRHDRSGSDPGRAPAAEPEEAKDLTIAADERIQPTGDVAGMSETME